MAENTKTKQTLTGLARRLSELPSDKKRVALETSAALAGVSLKVSREFVEAVPKAARILSADDLRHWGEFGRRLAMGSSATGAAYFAAGVEALQKVPEEARGAVFRICTRQLVLSSSIALESYNLIPEMAAEVEDDQLLTEILSLASEIAQRSAKHSADFLVYTPSVAASVTRFNDPRVTEAVKMLASDFATRTGGLTAELWEKLPEAFENLSADAAVKLMETAAAFLEFGGSVTLHFVASGSKVLADAASTFNEWSALARTIAGHGNAVLIAFLRATPKLTAHFAARRRQIPESELTRVLQVTANIAEADAESALAAYRSSPFALAKVSVEQFEEWVENGLRLGEKSSAKA
ncbi:MAG: hypothetical protein AB7J13_13445, partial [Pyrinomonadaceae bacterium]